MKGYMLNGEFVEGSKFVIDPSEPFFVHGHGLFETVRVAGRRPLFLRPHFRRMRDTAKHAGLHCGFDEATLRGWIDELLTRTEVTDARLKFMLLARKGGESAVMVTAESVLPLPSEFPPIRLGRAADSFQGRGMAGMKTMNYMVNRLAEAEGLERDFEEVYFLNDDGVLTEGSKSNLFFIRGNRLATSSLDLPILPGVTRKVILWLGQQIGLEVEEGHYRQEDFESADEVFVTGSFSLFRPVRQFDEGVSKAAPGPRTLELIRSYLALVKSAAELPDGEDSIDSPPV